MFLPLRVGHDDKRAHADVDDDEIRSEQVEGPEERDEDGEVDHLVHHQEDQLQTEGAHLRRPEHNTEQQEVDIVVEERVHDGDANGLGDH